ncbi:MAG: GNAT family N-acetyltransferase [bacterium]
MGLSLVDIEKDPGMLSYRIPLENTEDIVLRPLEHTDIKILTNFLKNLSKESRKNYILNSYDERIAQEFSDAISRYDKLRFLLIKESTNTCIGIFEYSLDIPENDEIRFKKYNIQLDAEIDCRIGPCISDEYQNQGLGSIIFPYLIKIAKTIGKQRMILWGGVFSDNERAISFYKKKGFKPLGSFVNQDDKDSLDMIIDID